MDDKMPCGAPIGVMCLCHDYVKPANWDLTGSLPAAEVWVPRSKRSVEVPNLSVSGDGPA
jgi:hypothetical protein